MDNQSYCKGNWCMTRIIRWRAAWWISDLFCFLFIHGFKYISVGAIAMTWALSRYLRLAFSFIARTKPLRPKVPGVAEWFMYTRQRISASHEDLRNSNSVTGSKFPHYTVRTYTLEGSRTSSRMSCNEDGFRRHRELGSTDRVFSDLRPVKLKVGC